MNIVPTRRLYLVLLFILPLTFIGSRIIPGIGAGTQAPLTVSTFELFWLLDLLVAIIFVIDIFLTPNKKILSVEREMDKRFSIGRTNEVTIVIENRSNKTIHCRITDDYPQEMTCPQCDFSVVLQPASNQKLTYVLIPGNKGVYNFGPVYVRIKSKFGLFERQIKLKCPEQVRVYNDLQGLAEISVNLASSSALGEIQRKNRGQGTNFTGLTEYVVGKDVTKIDWKATARTQRPIIREYDREEEQRLLILVDGGRMMFSELSGITKFDHALNAALSLSLTALTLNDQVGLGIFADEPLAYLPPRRGKAYLQKFLDAAANVLARSAEPDYSEMLAYFASRQKGRTLFIVLTDLVDTWGSRSLLSALALLRQKHLTFCVVLADERIEKITQPPVGAAAMPPTRDTYQYEKVLQRAVATDLLIQRQLALDVLQRRGCLVLNAPPEQLSNKLIKDYLEIKRRALL